MRMPRPHAIDAFQGLLVLALAAIWWPALTTHYGLSDDYSFLAYWGHPDLKVVGSDIVRMGRPLTAVLMRVAFLAYENVEDLVGLRALSAAFMAWFGVLLFRSLTDAGWPPYRAWMASLLVLATPPFIVYAGWAITCVGPISAVAALAGSRAYLQAFCWHPEASFRSKTTGLAVAMAMVVVAACLYQPTVGLFLLLPLASALVRPGEASSARRWLWLGGAVVVFLGALALYFVLFKLTMTSLVSADWASQRGALVSGPPGQNPLSVGPTDHRPARTVDTPAPGGAFQTRLDAEPRGNRPRDGGAFCAIADALGGDGETGLCPDRARTRLSARRGRCRKHRDLPNTGRTACDVDAFCRRRSGRVSRQ